MGTRPSGWPSKRHTHRHGRIRGRDIERSPQRLAHRQLRRSSLQRRCARLRRRPGTTGRGDAFQAQARDGLALAPRASFPSTAIHAPGGRLATVISKRGGASLMPRRNLTNPEERRVSAGPWGLCTEPRIQPTPKSPAITAATAAYRFHGSGARSSRSSEGAGHSGRRGGARRSTTGVIGVVKDSGSAVAATGWRRCLGKRDRLGFR